MTVNDLSETYKQKGGGCSLSYSQIETLKLLSPRSTTKQQSHGLLEKSILTTESVKTAIHDRITWVVGD